MTKWKNMFLKAQLTNVNKVRYTIVYKAELKNKWIFTSGGMVGRIEEYLHHEIS